MIITGKAIIERTKRAYTVYLAKLKAERESLFELFDDPSDQLENLNVEIELTENMIQALDFEYNKAELADA